MSLRKEILYRLRMKYEILFLKLKSAAKIIGI